MMFAVQTVSCAGKEDALQTGASSLAVPREAQNAEDTGSGETAENGSGRKTADGGTAGDSTDNETAGESADNETAVKDSSADNSEKNDAAVESSDEQAAADDLPAITPVTVSPEVSSVPEADSGAEASSVPETSSDSETSSVPEEGIITESSALKDLFQPLCQYPELPNGCEITSLAAVLQYLGFSADKCDLSDNYLPKGPVGTVSFYEAFEGDPREDDAFGCYAPVIVNTAEQYLSANGSSLSVNDLTGSALEDLFSYTDRNIPVLVWATQDCREGHYSVTWNVNGEDLTWFTPEHCVVLVGYDDTMIWVADPMYGDIRGYLRDVFTARYESLYRQAIVIE